MLSWQPTQPPHAAREAPPSPQFRVDVSDVLEVRFGTRPEWDCLVSVDVDGRLPLGNAGRPQVGGKPIHSISAIIAESAHLQPEDVTVRLAEIRSARVYIQGPANERARSISFRDSERLSSCLRRAGVFDDPAADLTRVTLIRPNVSIGDSEQIIPSDLTKTQTGDGDHDPILHPSDLITIDETWQSRLRRILPEWLLFFLPSTES